jgi:acyl-CoA thioesterase FadM
MLDIETIVEELKRERDRLSQAIAALEGQPPKAEASVVAGSVHVQVNRRKRKRTGLTPEGRERLSEMMKKRWEKARKKGLKGHLYKSGPARSHS